MKCCEARSESIYSSTRCMWQTSGKNKEICLLQRAKGRSAPFSKGPKGIVEAKSVGAHWICFISIILSIDRSSKQWAFNYSWLDVEGILFFCSTWRWIKFLADRKELKFNSTLIKLLKSLDALDLTRLIVVWYFNFILKYCLYLRWGLRYLIIDHMLSSHFAWFVMYNVTVDTFRLAMFETISLDFS